MPIGDPKIKRIDHADVVAAAAAARAAPRDTLRRVRERGQRIATDALIRLAELEAAPVPSPVTRPRP